MNRVSILISVVAITLIGLISAGAVASGSAQETSSDSDIEANLEIVRRFVEDAWEQGDLALLDDLVSPTGTGNVAGLPPQAPGPEGYKQLIATFRQAFPDLGYEVHSLIASGDHVVAEWTLHGTFLGELQGLAPTGGPIEVAGISIFWIEDGRIVDNHTVFDTMTFAQQTGARSVPAAAPGTPESTRRGGGSGSPRS